MKLKLHQLSTKVSITVVCTRVKVLQWTLAELDSSSCLPFFPINRHKTHWKRLTKAARSNSWKFFEIHSTNKIYISILEIRCQEFKILEKKLPKSNELGEQPTTTTLNSIMEIYAFENQQVSFSDRRRLIVLMEMYANVILNESIFSTRR